MNNRHWWFNYHSAVMIAVLAACIAVLASGVLQ
jgi:hypothetical protein